MKRHKTKKMILVNDVKYEKDWNIIETTIYYLVYKRRFRRRYYWYMHLWLRFPYIFLRLNDAQMALDEIL